MADTRIMVDSLEVAVMALVTVATMGVSNFRNDKLRQKLRFIENL